MAGEERQPDMQNGWNSEGRGYGYYYANNQQQTNIEMQQNPAHRTIYETPPVRRTTSYTQPPQRPHTDPRPSAPPMTEEGANSPRFITARTFYHLIFAPTGQDVLNSLNGEEAADAPRADDPHRDARRGSAPPVVATTPDTFAVSRESTLRSIDRQIETKCLDSNGNPIPEKEVLRKALIRKKLRLLQHGRRAGRSGQPGGAITSASVSASGGSSSTTSSAPVHRALVASDYDVQDIEAAPDQPPPKEPRRQDSKRSGKHKRSEDGRPPVSRSGSRSASRTGPKSLSRTDSRSASKTGSKSSSKTQLSDIDDDEGCCGGFCTRLSDELLITGTTLFDWFTPSTLGDHWVLFTPIVALAVIGIFLFMGAQYGFYLARRCIDDTVGGTLCGPSNLDDYFDVGPQSMVYWVPISDTFVEVPQDFNEFDANYLILWGARFDPLIFHEHEWWRWITSIFVHVDVYHMFTNIIAFLPISYYLEERFGFWRILPIFVLSGIGGNFFSALIESECQTTAGLSGAVYGLVGTLVADLVVHFRTITRPILRIIFFLAILITLTYEVARVKDTSSWSHIGGLVIGIFPASLFLRSTKNTLWDSMLPFLGFITFILVFVFLPLQLYGIGIFDYDWGDSTPCFCTVSGDNCIIFPRDARENEWPVSFTWGSTLTEECS